MKPNECTVNMSLSMYDSIIDEKRHLENRLSIMVGKEGEILNTIYSEKDDLKKLQLVEEIIKRK